MRLTSEQKTFIYFVKSIEEITEKNIEEIGHALKIGSKRIWPLVRGEAQPRLAEGKRVIGLWCVLQIKNKEIKNA